MVTSNEARLRQEQLWAQFGFTILGASLVLGAFVFGTSDTRIFVGPPLALGALFYWLALRVAPRPSRKSRLNRDGALVLPRRVAYGVCLSASLQLLAFGLLSMGALGIGDPDAASSSRYGDPAVGLVLFSIPMFGTGVLLAFGTMLGRGRLQLTPTHVELIPLVGRTRRLAWDQVRSADLTDQDTTLLIRGPLSRMIVPLSGQRWQGPLIQRIVRQYLIESDAERSRMTDPRILDSWAGA